MSHRITAPLRQPHDHLPALCANPDGLIMWCEDWGLLDAIRRVNPEIFRVRDGGAAGTFGHTDLFLLRPQEGKHDDH